MAFGVPIHIFTEEEIVSMLDTARGVGFEITSRLDFSADEKVVTWAEYGLAYTFIVITLRKLP
jgi:hypothetical protein